MEIKKVVSGARTWNRFISGRDAFYYGATEFLRLSLARSKCSGDYREADNPLVSVYIPTYNRADLLMQRSVPSVLAQTYKNFELIIVGDHCTDNTEELVKNIADPRIIFFNLPQRGYRYPPTAENHWLAGPVVPANKALELVSGKWICRIDDDDSWTPGHIEELLRFAQRGDYEFVSANYITEREGKKVVIKVVGAKDPYYTRRKTFLEDKGPLIGGTSTWLYRSYLKLFKYNINCWRKSWNRVNDVDLSQRFFKAGVRMGFLEGVVSYVLPRPGETKVGLEAYKIYSDEKLTHYSFKD